MKGLLTVIDPAVMAINPTTGNRTANRRAAADNSILKYGSAAQRVLAKD